MIHVTDKGAGIRRLCYKSFNETAIDPVCRYILMCLSPQTYFTTSRWNFSSTYSEAEYGSPFVPRSFRAKEATLECNTNFSNLWKI